MLFRKLMFRLGTCLLLCSWVTITVKGQATKTVKVDCTKGKSINTALNANQHVDQLTIEIDGICYENVHVENAENVTLIGDDPDEDGINGVSTDPSAVVGTTITIRRSTRVTLENLKITGGANNGIGVSYSNAIRVENCIVEDNAVHGLSIGRSSIVRVFNSEITGGLGRGGNGVQVTNSSIAELTDTKVVEGGGVGVSVPETTPPSQ